MKPGETVCADNALEINVGRDTLMLEVANLGDRPIQVGSSVKTMAAATANMAKRVLIKPYCRVAAALRASRARNTVVPKAVLPTAPILRFRAFFAVKRSAKSSRV